jgi:hypothetical protein
MSQAIFSVLTSAILLFRWTMVSSRLPLVAIRSLPIGIFTELTHSLCKALNLALDWATFPKTDQFNSVVICSFLLKLIPIALSRILNSLLIVIPTICESLLSVLKQVRHTG